MNALLLSYEKLCYAVFSKSQGMTIDCSSICGTQFNNISDAICIL